MKWIYLAIAILTEVVATTALNESKGFTKLVPSLITILGYSGTFYFLSLALREIPVGTAYAIWAGLGIFLITLIGYFRFKQSLDFPAILGMLLIMSGVIVIYGFSKTTSH